MSSTTYPGLTIPSPRSSRPRADPRQIGPRDVLLLSAWCGLAGGLLEVGMRVLCRSISPRDRLYQMNRHFVWLAPLTYLMLFLTIGLFFATVTRFWPRRGGWLSRRLIVASALAPAFIVAGPQIYYGAMIILALGAASRLVPWFERHAIQLRRGLLWSFPGLVALVLVLAGSVFADDWVKQRREAGRPVPPADSPNVLLIVLDTVRADHLSLYGYHRATTPKLEQFAKLGIRFENGPRHRTLDPPLTRKPVHGPLAPRARRGMDDTARREVPHAGRVPGITWLCDRGFRRQYPLLFL